MKITIEQLVKASHAAMTTFTNEGVTYYGDTTDERLTDLISGLHHFSDTYQFPWENLLEKAETLYKNDLKNQSKP